MILFKCFSITQLNGTFKGLLTFFKCLEEEGQELTPLDERQVALTRTHDKLLASASKKRKRGDADSDPDWTEETLDRVQVQSLKKRLTKLQAEKQTIIDEFGEKKARLLKSAKSFVAPPDASSELRSSMKVCRSFFSHLIADYIEVGHNHVVMLKDDKGRNVPVVDALVVALQSASKLLKAPSTTADVDEKIKLVRSALVRKKEEELLAKQAKERERLKRALSKLDDSQLIDDNYGDEYLSE